MLNPLTIMVGRHRIHKKQNIVGAATVGDESKLVLPLSHIARHTNLHPRFRPAYIQYLSFKATLPKPELAGTAHRAGAEQGCFGLLTRREGKRRNGEQVRGRSNV